MNENEFYESITKQLKLLTSLVARMTFNEKNLKELLTKGSKKPKAIIKIYNACNGMFTITKIAKEVGVTQSTVTRAVDKWEKVGTVLKMKKKGQVYPIGLYQIKE